MQNYASRFKPVAAGTVVILLITILCLKWRFGELGLAACYLSGKQVALVPRLVNLGNVTPGESIDLGITATNLTKQTLYFSGAEASCGCLATEGFPLTLLGFKSASLNVTMVAPVSPGLFSQSVVFYTEVNGHLIKEVVSIVGQAAESD